VPENLLETELFGHVRGAFTGAHQSKKGLWEAADGGTLFLDEVGEIPPAFQVKLLRALQEGTIRRVGSVKEIPVDVRIISAGNQDVSALVREGRFRQDLYYRINVVPIHLPPLRDRPEDIRPLTDSILERLSRRMGRRVPKLTAAARRRLQDYPWPGNVRELENTLERTLIFHRKDRIDAEDLNLEAPGAPPRDGEDDWNMTLEEVEKRHILRVLARCGHNKTRAAQVLGIGTNTLWRKLKKF